VNHQSMDPPASGRPRVDPVPLYRLCESNAQSTKSPTKRVTTSEFQSMNKEYLKVKLSQFSQFEVMER
jgi:hypothetical protein